MRDLTEPKKWEMRQHSRIYLTHLKPYTADATALPVYLISMRRVSSLQHELYTACTLRGGLTAATMRWE